MTPAPASLPATAPLATTIQPAAATQVITLPGTTHVIPGHLLSDADALYAANTLGIGKELGLLPAATPAAVPASTPIAIEGAGAETAPVEGKRPDAAAPLPAAAAPANETPEQKIARLESELAAARGPKLPVAGTEPAPGAAAAVPPAPALPAMVPTAGNPLVNLRTPEHFTVSETAARELSDWAFRNRDGGVLPASLAQLAENAEAARTGRAPATVDPKDLQVDGDTASGMYTNAQRMLTQFLPARREFVRQESAVLGHVAQAAPALFDPKTPEGGLFAKISAAYPELRSRAEWPLIVRDLVTGFMANNAAKPAAAAAAAAVPAPAPAPGAAAAMVPDETGKLIPFAGGGAPIGGAAPAGSPASQRQIDEAYERVRKGTHTDDDLTILGAAAV